jgi:AcrR family transcriptional regulator
MARVTEAHVEARRDQILSAAWICFARKGYHQITMQEIAEEAGLSAGAIYRYFPGKQAVLLAINERSQQMGRALVEAARQRATGPLDTLEVLASTMLSFFNEAEFESVTRVNIEMWPEIIRNAGLRNGMGKELAFWHEAVSALMREAKARGELREDVDPDALTTVFMCAWEGLRHYRLIDRRFGPQAILDVMHSLLSDQARERSLEFTLDKPPADIPAFWPAAAAPPLKPVANTSRQTRKAKVRATPAAGVRL